MPCWARPSARSRPLAREPGPPTRQPRWGGRSGSSVARALTGPRRARKSSRDGPAFSRRLDRRASRGDVPRAQLGTRRIDQERLVLRLPPTVGEPLREQQLNAGAVFIRIDLVRCFVLRALGRRVQSSSTSGDVEEWSGRPQRTSEVRIDRRDHVVKVKHSQPARRLARSSRTCGTRSTGISIAVCVVDSCADSSATDSSSDCAS